MSMVSPRGMRFVINAINASSPGAFQIVSNLLETLAEIESGDNFLVLLPADAGYEKLGHLGIHIVTRFYKWHISKTVGYLVFYLLQYNNVIKSFRPDVSLVFGSVNPISVGVPTVVLVQNAFYVGGGSISELPWLDRLKKNMEIAVFARTVKRTDLFLVESEYIGNRLSKMWGVSSDRIRVVANPAARVFISREERRPERPEELRGKFLLLYPSKMYPYKNHTVIIEIAKELRNRNIGDVIFLLTVGKSGNKLTKRFWEEVNANCIEEMIVNIGEMPVEELFKW
jgi:hypothetical protein